MIAVPNFQSKQKPVPFVDQGVNRQYLSLQLFDNAAVQNSA